MMLTRRVALVVGGVAIVGAGIAAGIMSRTGNVSPERDIAFYLICIVGLAVVGALGYCFFSATLDASIEN